MPLPGDHNRGYRGSDGWAVVRILAIQVLVLVALCGAIVRYLIWSSDTNWAEFVATSQTSQLASQHRPRSDAPAQMAKSQPPHHGN